MEISLLAVSGQPGGTRKLSLPCLLGAWHVSVCDSREQRLWLPEKSGSQQPPSQT